MWLQEALLTKAEGILSKIFLGASPLELLVGDAPSGKYYFLSTAAHE